MAVERTGAIYKSLFFDGDDSRDYGVYITGEAVYNAPEREVEMISIPGRSGQLALDKGRFENIEVTYPAGIYADNEADFAEAISNFRNFLCSRNGYVRLQDDYNPNEYRLAIYKSGLEVKDAFHRAGEFDIVFDCKPQRYLTSGETAISVDSGDVITNPTLFESSPLLEISGEGTVSFNGYSVSLENAPYGDVIIKNYNSYQGVFRATATFNGNYANIGDVIEIKGNQQGVAFGFSDWLKAETGTITDWEDEQSWGGANYGYTNLDEGDFFVYVYSSSRTDTTFVYGTAKQVDIGLEFTLTTSNYGDVSGEESVILRYDGANTFTLIASISMPEHIIRTTGAGLFQMFWGEIVLHSSASVLGNPLYIDTDIGEAYKIEDGEVLSVNSSAFLGSDLPRLASGANMITFDNTITDLKIRPRWWKV